MGLDYDRLTYPHHVPMTFMESLDAKYVSDWCKTHVGDHGESWIVLIDEQTFDPIYMFKSASHATQFSLTWL